MGFIDLHAHILPGLDDGARDLDASMAIVRGLSSLGFATICATPHQKASQFLPSLEDIAEAHGVVSHAVEEAGLGIEIPLAAENMWDGVFFERFTSDSIPAYSGGPAFLVEFQVHELPVGLMDTLFRMRARGRLPVIAHPERYQPLWKTPGQLETLAEQCAMVVDLGAVAGYHGRPQAKAARSMLKKGLAHAAASDAHSPEDVRVAAEGIGWIRKKLGADAVQRLLADNPRRILAGQHPAG